MGKVEKLVPRRGLSAREFLLDYIENWSSELEGVVVVGVAKDGELVSGWSREATENSLAFLGAIDQLKMDFWHTLFPKRADTNNNG
jgi:hypothetical protein